MLVMGIILGFPVLYLHSIESSGNYTRRDIISTTISNLAMLPYITGKKLIIEHISYDVQLFPGDNALWSISFEVLASICFVILVRFQEVQLRTFCFSWFGVLIIASFFHGFTDYNFLFDMNSGFDSENILGGFPRLFYSFSAGMLLYRWRFSGRTRRPGNMNRDINPWILYTALIAMFICPLYIKGMYSLFAVAAIAPAVVWFGSLSVCRGHFASVASEFLGWLSYPLYCVHMPICEITRTIFETYNLNDAHRIAVSIFISVTTAIFLAKFYEAWARKKIAIILKF